MFFLLAYQHVLVVFKAVGINMWAMIPLENPISKNYLLSIHSRSKITK